MPFRIFLVWGMECFTSDSGVSIVRVGHDPALVINVPRAVHDPVLITRSAMFREAGYHVSMPEVKDLPFDLSGSIMPLKPLWY